MTPTWGAEQGLAGGEAAAPYSAEAGPTAGFPFGRPGGGQRVAMRQGGTLSYLLTDHLGSTALTVNSSGVKIAELRYKAYGETRYTWGATPTTFNFTGQRLDSSTNLLYYGARYYDPLLGRFLSADTVVPGAANPQALNRYAYVLNNPLRYTDPSGHFPWPLVPFVVIAIFMLVAPKVMVVKDTIEHPEDWAPPKPESNGVKEVLGPYPPSWQPACGHESTVSIIDTPSQIGVSTNTAILSPLPESALPHHAGGGKGPFDFVMPGTQDPSHYRDFSAFKTSTSAGDSRQLPWEKRPDLAGWMRAEKIMSGAVEERPQQGLAGLQPTRGLEYDPRTPALLRLYNLDEVLMEQWNPPPGAPPNWGQGR